MQVRYARLIDIPKIEALYEQLFEAMAEIQPKYIQPDRQDRAYIKELIVRKDTDILVAQMADEVIGFLAIQKAKTPDYAGLRAYHYAFIVDTVVHKAHRGKGVGTKLLASAKHWAQERKVDYMELTVIAENTHAIRLYERDGYGITSHTMRLEFDK